MRDAKSPTGHLAIARAGDIVYLEAHGHCEAPLGPSLKRIAEQLQLEGLQRFVVDLQRVETMDSTFMGVLLGIHLHQVEAGGDGVVIANPSDHCRKLMGVLGITRIVEILPDAVDFPELVTTPLEHEEVSDSERIQLIQEAHQRLVAADQRNVQKFGALLAALEGEDGR
jgi:anti-anti-sigma factor